MTMLNIAKQLRGGTMGPGKLYELHDQLSEETGVPPPPAKAAKAAQQKAKAAKAGEPMAKVVLDPKAKVAGLLHSSPPPLF